MIIREGKQEKELYIAYGFTVYGKEATYLWTYDGSNRDEKCYTAIRIASDGKEMYNRTLGNNIIFQDCFNKNIDNVLYWMGQDAPNTWDIEKTIQSTLINNNCLFSYKIEQRKRKEKIEAEREAETKKEKRRKISTSMN